jgi:uncharacterized membrane protein
VTLTRPPVAGRAEASVTPGTATVTPGSVTPGTGVAGTGVAGTGVTGTGVVAPQAVRASLSGVALAVAALCVSLTPSLLPRTWLVQGLVSGVSATIGYGVGVVVGWPAGLVRRTRLGAMLPHPPRSVLTRLLAFAAPPIVLFSLYKGWAWQRDLHELMGAPPPGWPSYGLVLAIGTLVPVLLVLVVRGARSVSGLLSVLLARWVPRGIATLAAGLVVAALVGALLEGVVADRLVASANVTAETINHSGGLRGSPPTTPSRSGSPASKVPWGTLGKQGRAFTSAGPTLSQLRAFSASEPTEPIRVYAGSESARSVEAEADLAVAELERTGAFSRRVLCVVTTTGTGWVDPFAADALEYMFNGDTAIVGIQYSYLPSWMSFLSEKQVVEYAGRVLFERVRARWARVPVARRPKLLVFGESLGSLGSEAAFGDLADVRTEADGVLWIGPTNANALWTRVVAGRDRRSSEIRPVVDQGAAVRFAAEPADLALAAAPWQNPRIVYLQNPSDPVVWWSPDLLLRKPDWLSEPRGADVLPAMRWYPFLTFCQVTADLALAEGAPQGHGHRYHRVTVAGWAAVAGPAGWTAEDSARLTALLSVADARGR